MQPDDPGRPGSDLIDNGLDLFTHVLDCVMHLIRLLPFMRAQPVYYRHLCAWAHTAQLMQQLHPPFPPSPLDSFARNHLPLAKYLDLIEAPLSRDHAQSLIDVRLFLLGRVLKVLSTYPEKVQGSLESASRLKAMFEMFQGEVAILEYLERRPLELEAVDDRRDLIGALPSEQDQLIEMLCGQLEHRLECAVWAMLEHATRFLAVSADRVQQISSILAATHLRSDDNFDLDLFNALATIAHVAANLMSEQPYNEVTRLCAECAVRIDRDADAPVTAYLVVIGVIASDSSGNPDVAFRCLGSFLIRMAATLPGGRHLDALLEQIEVLKYLLPARYWHFSRARAIALSGADTNPVASQ